jgi:hypothetical protein
MIPYWEAKVKRKMNLKIQHFVIFITFSSLLSYQKQQPLLTDLPGMPIPVASALLPVDCSLGNLIAYIVYRTDRLASEGSRMMIS